MLTTTVDGLWVLQAVTGVEQTCPELGLRPLLPRLDTRERALSHPVAAELAAVGALDQSGNADPMIREWLTVLLRRDLGLLVYISVPGREPSRAASVDSPTGGWCWSATAICCVFTLPERPATTPRPVIWC